jgi:hypothetical protein
MSHAKTIRIVNGQDHSNVYVRRPLNLFPYYGGMWTPASSTANTLVTPEVALPIAQSRERLAQALSWAASGRNREFIEF